jgi:hypothetical protein
MPCLPRFRPDGLRRSAFIEGVTTGASQRVHDTDCTRSTNVSSSSHMQLNDANQETLLAVQTDPAEILMDLAKGVLEE